MSLAPPYCCAEMRRRAEYVCPDLDANHHGDPLDCPDRLVTRRSDGSFGLVIHDGGSASIDVAFCPWCGRRLGPIDG